MSGVAGLAEAAQSLRWVLRLVYMLHVALRKTSQHVKVAGDGPWSHVKGTRRPSPMPGSCVWMFMLLGSFCVRWIALRATWLRSSWLSGASSAFQRLFSCCHLMLAFPCRVPGQFKYLKEVVLKVKDME